MAKVTLTHLHRTERNEKFFVCVMEEILRLASISTTWAITSALFTFFCSVYTLQESHEIEGLVFVCMFPGKSPPDLPFGLPSGLCLHAQASADSDLRHAQSAVCQRVPHLGELPCAAALIHHDCLLLLCQQEAAPWTARATSPPAPPPTSLSPRPDGKDLQLTVQ